MAEALDWYKRLVAWFGDALYGNSLWCVHDGQVVVLVRFSSFFDHSELPAQFSVTVWSTDGTLGEEKRHGERFKMEACDV